MPRIEFESLPPSARVWVFGAAAPVTGLAAQSLLRVVDEYLSSWRAHGVPLTNARDWRDDRFLAIAVDEAATGASGCSIDGMFRALVAAEPEVGTSLVNSGAVYWRDDSGEVLSASRAGFRTAAARGEVTAATPVFDTTINSVADWRERFERPAHASWHGRLLPTEPN